jgi:hypothetical protein
MAMEGIRGYLQLASGLAEMSRAKAMEAASALLAVSGSVSSSVASVPGAGAAGSLTSQVQDLAEELLAAAAANRRSLVALIRTEVENAVQRGALMPLDELDRARAAVAKLSADVEELRGQVMASPAVRSIPEPGRSALTAMSDAMSGAVAGAASSVLGQRPQPAAVVTVPAVTSARPDALPDALLTPGGSVGAVAPRPVRRAPRKQTDPGPATTAVVTTSAAKTSTPAKRTPVETSTAKKASTAKKPSTTTKASTTKASPSAKKASTATKASPSAKKASTTKASPSAKKASTATKASPSAKKASTTKASTTKASPSAKKSSTAKKASTGKKTATAKTSTAKKSASKAASTPPGSGG